MLMVSVVANFNTIIMELQVKNIPGDFETNNLFLNLSGIPASLLAGYLCFKLSARALFFNGFCLQVFAGLAIVFLVQPNDPTWTLPALLSAARIGNAFTESVVRIVHPKMFPTLFALTSLSYVTVSTKIISLPAPMVAEIDFPTPMLIFAISNIVAALVALLL